MKQTWWKEGIVYQIYPRSFYDSNGDGIGDLQGILQKLDYLKELGVDILWLTPIYQSPNADYGYDISDYHAIMEEFGTMADFDELLAQVHQRDMKLIMDLVVNHTSDEHAWFVESRSSQDNPYRDYYIWHPGKAGKAPNNWASFFGGTAWDFDEASQEYYLHLFDVKQPDLNWENETVRQAVYTMMKWWLDKGIDGFRMDVINLISKVPGFPDGDVGEDANGDQLVLALPQFANGPRIHEFLHEMNREVMSKYDVMSVGEMPGVSVEDGLLYSDEARQELNMVFQFEHMRLDEAGVRRWSHRPWQLPELRGILSRWQTALQGKGWNSLYWTNHDQPRPISRFGNDTTYRVESGKLLATILMTLQGTPYIYQGEEIGMTNVVFEDIADYQDVATLNFYKEAKSQGMPQEEIMRFIYHRARDNSRTPVSWSAEAQGGFTSGTPWMRINPRYPEINAAQALADKNSIYYYYQALIRLRKSNPVWVYGTYQLLLEDHKQVWAYLRHWEGQTLFVLNNFSEASAECTLPADLPIDQAEWVIGNYEASDETLSADMKLQPYESRVYRWEGH